MKKAMGLLTGLFVFAAVNAWALSIDTVTVTGTNSASGAVTVSATVNGIVSGAMVTYQVTSADGLARRYFYPTDVVGTSWSSSDWTPYFTGTFTIELTAFDYAGGMPVTASTTVTVTRDIYGTVNGIKYSTAPYDANGTWNNIDTGAVKLHDIGMINDGSGMSSIGCNLLNASPTISQYMTEEERDVAYTDTVGYKPAGTPYRFDVTLHARPRGFMGMGEIKRWIWSPYDTNSPDGRGVLVVDMLSCSPWRSSYSNALQSHVGFAPLFAPVDFTDMPTGMIMCTTAHYMDVGPTNAGTSAEARTGLRVNGHTGANSYLKSFFPDSFLVQQFGLTNVYDATNILAGFVQHFSTNGVPLDNVTQVTASFTRIEGGTNLVYDYNSDGIGDSGFEGRLDFEFHSAVAAQMGIGSTNVTQNCSLTGDLDGDRLADLITVVGPNWYVWFSTAQFQVRSGPFNLGLSGGCTTGDVDGDRLADLIITVDNNWYVWFSTAQYAVRSGPFNLGLSGEPVTGDVDGDRLADLIVVVDNNWYVWFSTAQYQVRSGPFDLGISGTPATGDVDGDRLADLMVVVDNNWYVWFSTAQYQVRSGPFNLGLSGDPTTGDVDGDRLADLMVVMDPSWYVWFSTAQYQVRSGPFTLSTP